HPRAGPPIPAKTMESMKEGDDVTCRLRNYVRVMCEKKLPFAWLPSEPGSMSIHGGCMTAVARQDDTIEVGNAGFPDAPETPGVQAPIERRHVVAPGVKCAIIVAFRQRPYQIVDQHHATPRSLICAWSGTGRAHCKPFPTRRDNGGQREQPSSALQVRMWKALRSPPSST